MLSQREKKERGNIVHEKNFIDINLTEEISWHLFCTS